MTDSKALWRVVRTLREDVRELRGQLDIAMTRVHELETQTPHARQLAYEADVAAADLAESGHYGHGSECECPDCYVPGPGEYDDYDPAPEHDDQAGVPECRITVAGREGSS